MPADNTMPVDGRDSLEQLKVMTERIPGMIFQFFRSAQGEMSFPYLAGSGTLIRHEDKRLLADDASYAFERIDPEDFPQLMTAIERSAQQQTPLATQFRLRQIDGQVRWIAARAQPEHHDNGTLWHGLMLDISEQVAHEAHLRKLSDTDALTNLANRRKLMKRLDEEISKSNRYGTPLSLMLLDLDHFKLVNDTWGHLQGDQVLSEFGSLCSELVREEDTLARLGGEEFAILLPLTPQTRCRALAERLRQRIANHDFGISRGHVTASIGIAEHRVGESRERLIDRADCSLYAAKEQGRNRVIGCLSDTAG
ncbi:GGDEF domain-containing protein [Aidingimonas lacisalsi]|uniref:GGDEF domain-containing protein n=1 Tax=Aidingimonas lacisalsi TaxID=2604086 RepID=UPI001F36E225|nr:diguanylate cyclase [Aidingimonas lacisalsi]